MTRVYTRLAWVDDSCGQDLAQYAMLVAYMALADKAGMTSVTNAADYVFTSIGGTIAGYTH